HALAAARRRLDVPPRFSGTGARDVPGAVGEAEESGSKSTRGSRGRSAPRSRERREGKSGGRAMNGRDLVLGSIRRSLGVSGTEAPRRTVTGERLARHPRGVVPERGAQPPRRRVNLFRSMLAEANGSTEEIASIEDLPAAVAAYLRSRNLPMS